MPDYPCPDCGLPTFRSGPSWVHVNTYTTACATSRPGQRPVEKALTIVAGSSTPLRAASPTPPIISIAPGVITDRYRTEVPA